MIFGIDFDGTFAADPQTFGKVVDLLHAAGHQCVLVTGRSDEGRYGAEVRDLVAGKMPIVFAGREWKRSAALSAGFRVDVWVDDNPEYIGPQALILAVEKGTA